ncbi:hypothetical protein MMC25_001266 [Agyrium rufum]|nr:hypothetical protein [Agyrium rufum]
MMVEEEDQALLARQEKNRIAAEKAAEEAAAKEVRRAAYEHVSARAMQEMMTTSGFWDKPKGEEERFKSIMKVQSKKTRVEMFKGFETLWFANPMRRDPWQAVALLSTTDASPKKDVSPEIEGSSEAEASPEAKGSPEVEETSEVEETLEVERSPEPRSPLENASIRLAFSGTSGLPEKDPATVLREARRVLGTDLGFSGLEAVGRKLRQSASTMGNRGGVIMSKSSWDASNSSSRRVSGQTTRCPSSSNLASPGSSASVSSVPPLNKNVRLYLGSTGNGLHLVKERQAQIGPKGEVAPKRKWWDLSPIWKMGWLSKSG